jgi:hypothetical protein
MGQLVFDLAGNDESYQTLDLSHPTHPRVEDRPAKKRRFFWWMRGGRGKPIELAPFERKFEWRKDFHKPLQMLCYPHVRHSHTTSHLVGGLGPQGWIHCMLLKLENVGLTLETKH